MTERARPVLSWTLLAASLALAATVLFVIFVAYLPAERRVSGLEGELRALYAREAELETRLQHEMRDRKRREQQIASLSAERQVLTRRVDALEKALAKRHPRR